MYDTIIYIIIYNIIIIIFAGIGIVINVTGCLIRGRRRWYVTYTSPRGLRSSEFRIWNRRAFQERKPYQFPGGMNNSPYYIAPAGRDPTTSRTPRLHNKQGVPHLTRSTILITVRIFSLTPAQTSLADR